jgi:thiol:disulfide interchange protein DsbD
LLEREVFLAIWIAIFALMSLYLFGKITLPHDSPVPFISVGRMIFGLTTLAFTIYMIPGLWGAPLQLISAFPPPQNYAESPQGFGGNSSAGTTAILPKGAVYGPHNIVSFEDYNEGIAYAKEINKPVLVDFTGRACQNCRLMESNVWSDEQVLQILKNEIVLISLFGDEQIKLPEAEQYTSVETNSDITTVGQKWTEFQRQKFKTNARPYYVLMDSNEKVLNTPVGYTPDVDEYLSWLKDGLKQFGKSI